MAYNRNHNNAYTQSNRGWIMALTFTVWGKDAMGITALQLRTKKYCVWSKLVDQWIFFSINFFTKK